MKVFERGPGRPPFEPGLAAMRELLGKRVPLSEAFADGVVDRLILASGGHLRGLLELVTDVLLRARRRGLPVDEPGATAAIARFNEKRCDAVRADAAPLLDTIRTQFSLDHVVAAELPRIAHYLDNHLVLSYRDATTGWYDVHPAVREHVARLAREAAGGPDAG